MNNISLSLEKFNALFEELSRSEKEQPVADFVSAEDLFNKLDLDLKDSGVSEDDFYAALRDLVLKTPRTATNAFFNQLFGGRNDKAILGELLAVMLNNSMYTYKAAGPQTGIEKVVLRKICDILGWGHHSDGTIAPGGSLTNFMAMLMARDVQDSKARHDGISGKMTVYTSAESHYSILKNAAFIGIGRNQVREISVDSKGVMNSFDLRNQIVNDLNNGFVPMMVNCTAGTTVLGAFDDIHESRKICDEFNIWLHVDGAYCGSVLFSNRYKHLINGIHLVDSFSFNAHKMLGTPLSCSIIVTKNKKHMYDSFSNDASYLYQTDHDEFNLGKTSIQCGRRNDALKFWTLWKSVGTRGLEKIVDHQFKLADTARDYVRNHDDYTLYSFDDSISVCFNYKDIPARTLCTALYEHSKLLVGYGNFQGEEFVRLVTINAQNDTVDILSFFSTLEQFVEENMAQLTNAVQNHS